MPKLTQEDADNLRKHARSEDISHIPNKIAWMLSIANAIEEVVQSEQVVVTIDSQLVGVKGTTPCTRNFGSTTA